MLSMMNLRILTFQAVEPANRGMESVDLILLTRLTNSSVFSLKLGSRLLGFTKMMPIESPFCVQSSLFCVCCS